MISELQDNLFSLQWDHTIKNNIFSVRTFAHHNSFLYVILVFKNKFRYLYWEKIYNFFNRIAIHARRWRLAFCTLETSCFDSRILTISVLPSSVAISIGVSPSVFGGLGSLTFSAKHLTISI